MCETLKRSVDVTVCEVVTPWVYPERQFTSRATVSVVIPTLNEALNIAEVLPRLPSGIDQVVLVDGGSTDGTVEVARRLRPDITVVEQTRQGKGNALACGFARATGDIIVMMDADGIDTPRGDFSFRRDTCAVGRRFRQRVEVHPRAVAARTSRRFAASGTRSLTCL